MVNVKTTIVQTNNTALSGNATTWKEPLATTYGFFAIATNEAIIQRPSGVYSNLRARVPTNTNNNTTVVRINNNGSNGNCSVSITSTQTGSFEDTSHTDTVTAGQNTFLQCSVVNGSTGSITFALTQIDFLANSDTHTSLSSHGAVNLATASTTNYHHLSATLSTSITTETQAQTSFQNSYTLKNFRIRITADNRSTNTTYRIRKNGLNGNQSIATTNTGEFEDTTNTDSVVANDRICVSSTTGTGSGTQTFVAAVIDVENTTNSSFPLISTGGGTLNFGTTLYETGGICLAIATEASAQVKLYKNATLKNLSAVVSANTVNGTTTFRMRKNAANANPVATIAASNTGIVTDVSNTTQTVASDLVNFQVVTAGSSGSLTYKTLHVEVAPDYQISTTKTHKYNITGFITRTRTHKYNITGKITANKTHKYNIVQKVTQTKTHKYNVIGKVTQTRTHKYNIIGKVTRTRTHVFSVLQQIIRTRTHKYNVIGKIVQTKTHKYDIIGKITKTKTHLFSILNTVSQTKTHKFDILNQVIRTRTHKYNVSSSIIQVSTTKTHKYDVSSALDQVVQTKTHLYNIIGKITQTKTHVFSVIQQVIATKTHKFNVLQQIIKTKTHKYDVIGKVVTTKTHVYNVIQQITKTRTHKYHVEGHVSTTKTHKFDITGVLNQVTTTKTHLFSILQQIVRTRTHKFDILQQIVRTRTHKYNIIGLVIRTRTHKFNIIGKLTVLKTHKFNLINRVSPDATKTHKFNILALVTRTRTHKYNVIGKVIRTRTHKYNMGGSIKTTKTHRYSVGSGVILKELGGSTNAYVRFPERVQIIDIIADISNLAIANVEIPVARPPSNIAIGTVAIAEYSSAKILTASTKRLYHRIGSLQILPQVIETIEQKAIAPHIAVEILPLSDKPQFQLQGNLKLTRKETINLQSLTQLKQDERTKIKIASATMLQQTPKTIVGSKAQLEITPFPRPVLAPEIMTKQRAKTLKTLINLLSSDELFS